MVGRFLRLMKELHKARKGFYFRYIFRWGPLPNCHNLVCQDMDAIRMDLMTQKRGLRLEKYAFPQFQEQVVLA